jgi:RNA polymerase sigma factor (sigma-70 family)
MHVSPTDPLDRQAQRCEMGCVVRGLGPHLTVAAGSRRPVPGAQDVDDEGHDSVVELVPLVRRVVAARVRNPDVVDDLVQETLARVMAAHARIESETLAPYAVVTARNLVASLARREERSRRLSHLVAQPDEGELTEHPEDGLLREENKEILGLALLRLPALERELLLAREFAGQDTATLAAGRGSTQAAIATQLSRSRAKLRVEYLLARDRIEPPTDRCRPVLYALSAGNRRRQRELDAGGHLLACDCCSLLAPVLLQLRPQQERGDEASVPIRTDADVVTARQKGRELAARAGFTGTDPTLVATAISETARNVIEFARRGQVLITVVSENERQGVTIVVRDAGPGIPDVERALEDGFSTHGGLGLGLPGARRLMDEFEIVSEVGKGTTVTMTKWSRGPGHKDPESDERVRRDERQKR